MKRWMLLAALCLPVCACDDGADDQETPPADASVDAVVDAGPSTGRVEIDLEPYLAVGGGDVYARQTTVADELVTGEAATGVVGDYILGNDVARFVVEREARVIGVCPYGGNVIDADTPTSEDVTGESCLLINFGQTLDPHHFEILRDGSEGTAVLAVTGDLTTLDFINLAGLLGTYMAGLELGYDVNGQLPVTITVYYILQAGDTALRVVTAIRNDTDEALHFPVGHLIDSGGDVDFFNPQGPYGGYGYRKLGADSLGGDRLTMLGFRGPRGSWGHLPDPIEGLAGDLPRSGAYVTVAGVAVTLLRSETPIPVLLAKPHQFERMPDLMHLEAGEVGLQSHWQLVGDRSLSTIMDRAWRGMEVPTGQLAGVVDAPGDRRDVAVTAIDAEGRTFNQTYASADGAFSLVVPEGTYRLRARADGRGVTELEAVVVVAGEETVADLSLGAASGLNVTVRQVDGAPVPARVVVRCEGLCPAAPLPNDEDVTFDSPAAGVAAIQFTDTQGALAVPLSPGIYRVMVTRGPEWSVWPATAPDDGGFLVELGVGEQVDVDAEVALVVNTQGALSIDMHVHGINSPDSPVTLTDRVLSFMAEGVDVLVSTDHDFITDYAPANAAVGGEAWLATVVGEEITTFDYGHYNGFPLVLDPTSVNGGALDWAGGYGDGLTPGGIFEWVHGQPGEQVMQVNHANDGFFSACKIDPMTGLSFGDRALLRLPPQAPDPVTGDTGLWSEDFTAFEIGNGWSVEDFNMRFRWWLAMVGRGFVPTATAVSDTHKTVKGQGGGPRSWVFMDEDYVFGDGEGAPATVDQAALVTAINAGRVIGSTGPFMRVMVVSGGEAIAGPGDTLAVTAGEPVQFQVHLDTPDWMTIDTLEVYANVTTGLETAPGEGNEDPVTPTFTQAIDWGASTRSLAAAGQIQHYHRTLNVDFEWTPEVDSYVVVVVRGAGNMDVLVNTAGVQPMAFANPVLLDVDGGGYDHPPLAMLAAEKRARLTTPEAIADRAAKMSVPRRAVTEADLHGVLESGVVCEH